MRNEYIIRVRPSSSERKIESFGDNRYLVKVKSTAHEEINKELIKMISIEFGVPTGRIKIIKGISENDKILKID